MCPRCLCTMKVVSHLTADCQNCRSQSQGNSVYRYCVCCLHAQGHCIPCRISKEESTTKAELRTQEKDKKYVSPLPVRETRPAREPGYRPKHLDLKPYEPRRQDPRTIAVCEEQIREEDEIKRQRRTLITQNYKCLCCCEWERLSLTWYHV